MDALYKIWPCCSGENHNNVKSLWRQHNTAWGRSRTTETQRVLELQPVENGRWKQCRNYSRRSYSRLTMASSQRAARRTVITGPWTGHSWRACVRVCSTWYYSTRTSRPQGKLPQNNSLFSLHTSCYTPFPSFYPLFPHFIPFPSFYPVSPLSITLSPLFYPLFPSFFTLSPSFYPPCIAII